MPIDDSENEAPVTASESFLTILVKIVILKVVCEGLKDLGYHL